MTTGQLLETDATVSNANTKVAAGEIFTIAVLFVFAFLLFYHLGSASLIEPDEGRNAEKAREILLSRDWVTPHEDFIPVLDKPMAFYWLIASAYRLFGVSEWAARLPSALAALGCVLVIYFFVRKFVGAREALWSAVVLAASTEFFILSRVVIFDMALTFFCSAALCCFYAGLHSDNKNEGRTYYTGMYACMAAATLVKGLLGMLLPGLVIVSFLLWTGRLRALREMQLPVGLLIFLLFVVPWYAMAEARNPGYLRYFFWEEHILRFSTSHFHRNGAWYYYFYIVAVGFLPWTLTLPATIRSIWRDYTDEFSVFCALWVALPFLFFSISASKLPHYVLPIYPALAVLAGGLIAKSILNTERTGRLLYLVWAILVLEMAYFTVGSWWPGALPEEVRVVVLNESHLFLLGSVLTSICLLVFVYADVGRRSRRMLQSASVVGGLSVCLIVTANLFVDASHLRSAKDLAQRSLPLIEPKDQVVIYEMGLEGLPYYLALKRPAWFVVSGTKDNYMGSFYLAEFWERIARAEPDDLLTFNQFAQRWKSSPERLLIFLDERNLHNLVASVGELPTVLATVAGRKGNFLLITIGKAHKSAGSI